MSLKTKNPAELLEIMEEAEKALIKEECFCNFYNRDIVGVALEALDRLRVISETVSGSDIDEESGFITKDD